MDQCRGLFLVYLYRNISNTILIDSETFNVKVHFPWGDDIPYKGPLYIHVVDLTSVILIHLQKMRYILENILFFWKFKRKAQLGTRNAFDNFLTGLNWPHLLKALEIILVKSNTIDAVFNVWCMTYVGWGHAATHTGRSGMECSWTLDTAPHESSGYPSDIPLKYQIWLH